MAWNEAGRGRPVKIYIALQLLLTAAIQAAIALTPIAVYGKLMTLPALFTSLAAAWSLRRKPARAPREKYFAIALLLLLPADLCLCFLQSFGGNAGARTAGFLFFFMLQTFLALSMGISRREGILRVIVLLLFEAVCIPLRRTALADCIGMANLSTLLMNTVFAWARRRRERTRPRLLFAAGISLFCACDYGILLRSLTGITALTYPVWLVYVPGISLLLLARLDGRK